MILLRSANLFNESVNKKITTRSPVLFHTKTVLQKLDWPIANFYTSGFREFFTTFFFLVEILCVKSS